MTRLISYTVGIAFSIIFLYLALQNVHFNELSPLFASISLWPILLLFTLIIFFYLIKAERWRMLLAPVNVTSTKKLFPSMIVGIAFNYILFGYLGEFIRAYLYNRESGLRKTTIFGTIILERVFDLVNVLLFLGIGLILAPHIPSYLSSAGYFITLVTLIAVALVAYATFHTQPFLNGLKKTLFWLPNPPKEKLLHHLSMIIEGLLAIKNISLFAGIIATTLGQWIVMGLCHYTALTAFGITVPFHAIFLTIALIVLGITLPSSPGHIGVIEFAYVLSLTPYGITASDAFAAAILYHITLYGTTFIIATLMVHHFGMTWEKIKKEAETTKLEKSHG